jgi:hypothetical protein
MDALRTWAEAYGWWLGAASLAMFVASAAAVPWIVARLPADHFVSAASASDSWRTRHPALRLTLWGAKNGLGALLVLAGVAMLVLPGQGILTILAGLSLLVFPGKRRLELAILRNAAVHRGIDWIRRRAGRPPLILPDRVGRKVQGARSESLSPPQGSAVSTDR